MSMHDHSPGERPQGGFPTSRMVLVFVGFAIIAGVLLFTEHRAHVLEMMFGWKTNPHAGPFHILSFVFIIAGFILISAGLKTLYDAQKRGSLATTGTYSYVRHPQYDGFILVMFGFLLQWPTLLTLAMFPVLVVMYVKLARNEGREALATFGDDYRRYTADVPGFIPRLLRLLGGPAPKKYGNG